MSSCLISDRINEPDLFLPTETDLLLPALTGPQQPGGRGRNVKSTRLHILEDQCTTLIYLLHTEILTMTLELSHCTAIYTNLVNLWGISK